MRKAYIPPRLRSKVEETARYRCGYCLTSRNIIGQQMHIEHILPRHQEGFQSKRTYGSLARRAMSLRAYKLTLLTL